MKSLQLPRRTTSLFNEDVVKLEIMAAKRKLKEPTSTITPADVVHELLLKVKE